MVESQKNTSLFSFLSVIALCILIGMIFIYSSIQSMPLSALVVPIIIKKQLAGFLLGIIGLIIMRFLPLPFIKKATPWVFCGTFFLTAAYIHSRHRSVGAPVQIDGFLLEVLVFSQAKRSKWHSLYTWDIY